MKKTIVNDISTFIVLLLCALASTFFLVVCLINISTITGLLTCGIALGVIVIGSFILMLISTNIITFYEDRVLARSIFKRVEIMYAQIESITYVGKYEGVIDKKIPSSLYVAHAWRIINANEQKIYVLDYNNGRAKYILPIQQMVKDKTTDSNIDANNRHD